MCDLAPNSKDFLAYRQAKHTVIWACLRGGELIPYPPNVSNRLEAALRAGKHDLEIEGGKLVVFETGQFLHEFFEVGNDRRTRRVERGLVFCFFRALPLPTFTLAFRTCSCFMGNKR